MKRIHRLLLWGCVFCVSLVSAQSTSLSCTASAVTTNVRAEGLTEQVGDIVLDCTGGAPGSSVTGNLSVILPVAVTNRVIEESSAPDVTLTIDTGATPQTLSATVSRPNRVNFNGLNFSVSATGRAHLRISGIRIAATQLGFASGMALPVPIAAIITITGPQSVPVVNSNLAAGIASNGLLASASSTAIVCTRSPLPDTMSFSALIAAGTHSYSTRVTEGFPAAFEVRQNGARTGARFMVSYSSLPQGARIFVPDVIAGSSAIQPTARGDFGPPVSPGRYKRTAEGSLLLALVRGAGSTGAGGLPVYTPGPVGSGEVAFDSVTEISLTNGAGYAVYEVMDANAVVRESAQWPTFVGMPRQDGGQSAVASQEITFAPVSELAAASTSAPIPRFAAVAPSPDCQALNDCKSSYMPRLAVDAPLLEFTAPAGSIYKVNYIGVENDGGGLLVWAATLTYKNGSEWIRLEQPSGLNAGVIRLDVMPEKLTPGRYEATLRIDAGPLAGTRSLPIRLDVTPGVAPIAPVPVIRTVQNAASLAPGPLVAGSLATIMGEKLGGEQVMVHFDGIPAKLLYSSDTQINLQVPEAIGAMGEARVVVSADGVEGIPVLVTLRPAAPAIFRSGILNQDSSLNTENTPAATGSIIQIFATGLPAQGTITAKIHDREIADPTYAGAAPRLDGVQQVNIRVPDDLPTMTTEVLLCATVSGSERLCSRPAPVTLQRSQ
ncbi:MAG: IPT/TIG domain-containing protein [Bryobacteraceae bacterium]|nr:IPT/TIG domain-containing protein [Bryobacterales bacterium]MEB2359949.1 IPT/TIG domain-containing protein [Bryobacterales bacterium]NUN00410.1 IPT/TIG domain-containing protein [Bryobacteraceae bacterium]